MSKPSPRNICHLFMSSEFGGLEKHVMELAGWQASHMDCKVSIIAHPRYQSQCPQGVVFLPVNTDLSRRNPLLLVALVRSCRRHGFDLIHGHGGKAAGVLASLRRFIPATKVITRHNIVHPKDAVARHFPGRIAVSRKAVANSALDWSVIPNGTHAPEKELSPPQQCADERRVVLSVARLVPAKGIDLLLQAWAELRPADASLYLVGDGPERNKLEALAQNLSLEGSVRFVGYSKNVAAWMQAAEFMVVSSHKEGAPYTVVEALLSGCPVISTDVGSNREILPAEFIAEDISVSAIAELLQTALQDNAALKRAFAPVFEYATKRLTVDAMAQATVEVYCRALPAN
ncbi:glycosyltransferase [Microbulbifer agarilyticus]|uniref:glycosyltransferase n=1 Tax=Microbulbifer agarilyticus TaxID=260552 RepID=UPI001C98A734|nr:glycosyltransferase [Microbulbifer agarilyticus]MBY6190191.1 glycosyltransferase [Microbulbifer agarilyticus]